VVGGVREAARAPRNVDQSPQRLGVRNTI
jgi:hypothetical protein